ncbi:hypothetical protein M378DRAFT_806438 [Amanita muscaria Koide BX008]|uniref:Uncharacterized protein n=1 Tax=Amanita muscaria (strain Koide BX008) TaxID=946122 RepID=A0A0C2WZ57_AMAMK|nr:hypothetical protein M378DRAFT_806438 [Amanita muscaria Koide BX008]
MSSERRVSLDSNWILFHDTDTFTYLISSIKLKFIYKTAEWTQRFLSACNHSVLALAGCRWMQPRANLGTADFLVYAGVCNRSAMVLGGCRWMQPRAKFGRMYFITLLL